MNRLATRLALAMMAVAVVSLLAITAAQAFIVTREYRQLPPIVRERLAEFRTRPLREPPRPENELDLLRGFERFRTAQLRSTVTGLSAAGVLSVLLALLLARTIARPVEAVSAAATRVAQGDFSARVALPEGQRPPAQEIAGLARDFNAMADSLETLERERKAMIADIAHELRTPLAAIQLRLEALLDGLVPFGREETQRLHRQAALLTRLVEDLRILSLADAGRLTLKFRDVDLAEVSREALESQRVKAAMKGVRLGYAAPGETLMGRFDPDRIAQVLGNLLDNALRVTPSGGTVRLALAAAAERIVLDVEDGGPGIPETDLPRIFERFAQGRDTRDEAHGNSGLGLAIVATLVKLHGGTITAANLPAGGARFTISLPRDVPTTT